MMIHCDEFAGTGRFQKKRQIIWLFVFAGLCLSCSKPPPVPLDGNSGIPGNTVTSNAPVAESDNPDAVSLSEKGKEVFIEDFWSKTFDKAELPQPLKEKLISNLTQGPDFVVELLAAQEGDPYLYALVDKQHPLSPDYVPGDLAELTDGSYRVTRQGLTLRREAAESLENMAAAAREEGVILTAASAYRSYDYQAGLYDRNVREMGQQAADRESARPGHSQHQLGLVVDFYPIDDSFAQTTAFFWLQKNAARFGWSLSFPENAEEITGYRWESWHYRYLGRELASFTDKYFDGSQQYALQFIFEWIARS